MTALGKLHPVKWPGHRFSSSLSGPALWALVGCFVVFGLFGVALPRLPAKQLTVRTLVAASGAATMAVYVNELESPLETVALAPGVETEDAVPVPPGGVKLIQLNFYGPVGDEVRLFAVQVLDGKRVVASSPPNLVGWELAFLYPSEPPGPTAHGFATLVTTEQTSAMHEYLNVPSPSYLPEQAQASDPLHRLSLSFWIGLVLALSAFSVTRHRRGLAAVVVVMSGLTVGALFLVSPHTGGLTSSGSAVGRATYLGLSVSSNLHAVEATYLVAGVVGVGVGLGRRRLRVVGERVLGRASHLLLPGRASQPVAQPKSVSPARLDDASVDATSKVPDRTLLTYLLGTSFLGSLAIAAVSVLTPDLLANLHSAASTTYVPNFDNDNALAWTVFAQRGLVPMRDFWYPYGNSLFLIAHPIIGSILDSFLNVSLLCGYGWCFWRLSGARRWVTWVALVALLLAEQFMPEFSRYSVGYLVPLLYWSIPPAGSARRWPGRLALAVAFGGGLFIEPDTIFYGTIGLGLSLIIELVADCRQGARILLDAAKNIAAPFGIAVLYISYSAAQGQLGGIWDIYGQTGGITAYSAWPTLLVSNLRSALGLDGIVIWAPAVTFGAGIFLRLRSSRKDVPVSRLLVSVAGCGFPLIEKDAVRPIPDQLRITLLLTALVVLVAGAAIALRSQRHNLGLIRCARALAIGGCVGALASGIAASPGLGVLRSGLRAFPTTLRDDVHVVLHLSEARALEQDALKTARFADYTPELQLASSVRRILGPTHDGLFVLGDDASLYVILDQNPPWTISSYNTSLISDQHRVVDWLARHKPQVVVFDESTSTFDEVPSYVRIPLVYQAVIAQYEPASRIGGYVVLRPRKAGQVPDGDFWVTELGRQVDLGFLPDSMKPTVPKLGPDSQQAPFLTLDRLGTSKGETSPSVPVRFGNVTLDISFNAVPGQQHFSIPLSRIWAWSLSSSPALGGSVSPGWVAHITEGNMPADRLY